MISSFNFMLKIFLEFWIFCIFYNKSIYLSIIYYQLATEI